MNLSVDDIKVGDLVKVVGWRGTAINAAYRPDRKIFFCTFRVMGVGPILAVERPVSGLEYNVDLGRFEKSARNRPERMTLGLDEYDVARADEDQARALHPQFFGDATAPEPVTHYMRSTDHENFGVEIPLYPRPETKATTK